MLIGQRNGALPLKVINVSRLIVLPAEDSRDGEESGRRLSGSVLRKQTRVPLGHAAPSERESPLGSRAASSAGVAVVMATSGIKQLLG